MQGEAALQGTWTGREVTPGSGGTATLAFVGRTLEFHGASADDWVKGTYTLQSNSSPSQMICTVTDCAAKENLGQRCYAIYKIDQGELVITGNALGELKFPASFDAPVARHFVLTHP
jgi:uncharacterized protein (TIGR03067 family)